MVLSFWLRLNPDSYLVPEQEQLQMIRDWPEHIRKDLYLLTFASHDIMLLILICLICAMLFLISCIC